MKSVIDLFEPIVPIDRQSNEFKRYANSPYHKPARIVANEIFSLVGDCDGNFLEQFQSTATDARTWELYLAALFHELNFDVRKMARPDFSLVSNDAKIFVEATVTQPTGGQPKDSSFKGAKSFRQRQKQLRDNEMPIKFGSALYSKLQKKYWKDPLVKDHPLIFAVAAFHSQESLHFTDASLARYLYAATPEYSFDKAGNLAVWSSKVDEHVSGAKKIPSGFFDLPESEFVSAVLFNNSGTLPKFNRIGYQRGLDDGNSLVVRCGSCYNPDPNATEPLGFLYKVGDSGFLSENWSHGGVLFHNPNAKHRVNPDYFPHFVQHFGETNVNIPHGLFYIYESRTFTFPGKGNSKIPVRSRLMSFEDTLRVMKALLLVSSGAKQLPYLCNEVFE